MDAPHGRPLVIGHRGAMAMAPENTMASFLEALRQGADGIECDVHLSRDGQVIVMHDATVDRTTNGTGPIAELTFEALSRLDAGSWYDPRFAGERVPTLDAVLSLVKAESKRQDRPLLAVIELKAGSRRYRGIEAAVTQAILAADLSEQTIIISFDHRAILETKRLAPTITGGVLYYGQPIDPVHLARTANADFLGPSLECVSAEEVELAHQMGLKVFVWTVQTSEQALALATLKVDAFGANAPALALAAF